MPYPDGPAQLAAALDAASHDWRVFPSSPETSAPRSVTGNSTPPPIASASPGAGRTPRITSASRPARPAWSSSTWTGPSTPPTPRRPHGPSTASRTAPTCWPCSASATASPSPPTPTPSARGAAALTCTSPHPRASPAQHGRRQCPRARLEGRHPRCGRTRGRSGQYVLRAPVRGHPQRARGCFAGLARRTPAPRTAAPAETHPGCPRRSRTAHGLPERSGQRGSRAGHRLWRGSAQQRAVHRVCRPRAARCRGELSEADVTGWLLTAALQVGQGEREARRTIASGLRAGARRPRTVAA